MATVQTSTPDVQTELELKRAPSSSAKTQPKRQAAKKNAPISETTLPSEPDYVTVSLASQRTGYTAKAIRRKIESGVWVEGREYRRAPDGHILISLKGYQQWVEQGQV
jgi:hypothetical protein